jgi:hypothetical protein
MIVALHGYLQTEILHIYRDTGGKCAEVLFLICLNLITCGQ